MTKLSSHLSQLRLKHLILLDLIDEHKSISKAAGALGLTQPAVSTMLQDLESVLEVCLVDRTRQGATLTQAGVLTRDRLRVITNDIEAVRASNAQARHGNHLRVGTLPVAMIRLIPSALDSLRKEMPQMTLRFVEGTARAVIDGVLENELDCAIGYMDTLNFPQERIQNLRFTPLSSVHLGIACNAANPLSRRRKVTLEQLAKEDWVLVEKGSQTRKAFDEAFVQIGITPPTPVIESISFFSNFHIIKSADFLTLAPVAAIDRYNRLGVIKTVQCFPWPAPPSQLLFICTQEKHNLTLIQLWKQCLLTAANDQ